MSENPFTEEEIVSARKIGAAWAEESPTGCTIEEARIRVGALSEAPLVKNGLAHECLDEVRKIQASRPEK